jgi:hypothetical protein
MGCLCRRHGRLVIYSGLCSHVVPHLFSPRTAAFHLVEPLQGVGHSEKIGCHRTSTEIAGNGNSAAAQIFFIRTYPRLLSTPSSFSARRSAMQHSVLNGLKNLLRWAPSVPGIGEAAVPLSVYAAMLSSQLIIAVAGRVPELDVGPSCRESTVPDCETMEKFAHDKLIKDWPTFTAHDREMCVMEEKMSGPPSYVGWLTCLEINANARGPEANAPQVGASTTATGKSAAPKRRWR